MLTVLDNLLNQFHESGNTSINVPAAVCAGVLMIGLGGSFLLPNIWSFTSQGNPASAWMKRILLAIGMILIGAFLLHAARFAVLQKGCSWWSSCQY